MDLRIFNCIAAFFASAFGPSEGKGGEGSKSTVSSCFNAMVSSVPQTNEARAVMSAAADLEDVVALSDNRAYWPGYAPSASSNVISLKWNATAPRFTPMEVDELAGEQRYAKDFEKDLPRARYFVSDDSNAAMNAAAKCHLKAMDGLTPDQAFDELRTHVGTDEDVSRITEVAHQGHLAQATNEVFSLLHADGEYMFRQKGRSTRHEVIANGGRVVTVRSSVEFEAVNKDDGGVLSGFSIYVAINTRIGFAGGKLDHKALGSELSNMALEIRYEKPKGDTGSLEALKRQEPDKLLMPV